jgi:hypothetical protein
MFHSVVFSSILLCSVLLYSILLCSVLLCSFLFHCVLVCSVIFGSILLCYDMFFSVFSNLFYFIVIIHETAVCPNPPMLSFTGDTKHSADPL